MGRHHREDDYTHPGNLLKALADGEIDIFDALEYAPLAAGDIRALYEARKYRAAERRKKIPNKVVDKVLRESI